MKKNPQGKRWHRLDNTGKIFPMIANENLSNVFRISFCSAKDSAIIAARLRPMPSTSVSRCG